MARFGHRNEIAAHEWGSKSRKFYASVERRQRDRAFKFGVDPDLEDVEYRHNKGRRRRCPNQDSADNKPWMFWRRAISSAGYCRKLDCPVCGPNGQIPRASVVER